MKETLRSFIFPLPLIQEEHLSVTGERMCTGKLPRRLAQEQCDKCNQPRPKRPKMC